MSHSHCFTCHCYPCRCGLPQTAVAVDSTAERPNLMRAMNVAARLMDYYNAEEMNRWLQSPHPQLEGRIPAVEMQEGRFDGVERVLDRLDADAYL